MPAPRPRSSLVGSSLDWLVGVLSKQLASPRRAACCVQTPPEEGDKHSTTRFTLYCLTTGREKKKD